MKSYTKNNENGITKKLDELGFKGFNIRPDGRSIMMRFVKKEKKNGNI